MRSLNSAISRRQMLGLFGSAAALGLTSGLATLGAIAEAPTTVTVTAEPLAVPATQTSIANKRFNVAGDDLFLNDRQNMQVFRIAPKAGVGVDIGRMPGG
jgi:hypothetical protein